MGSGIEFEVCGDYAMFTDPVNKLGGEKYSYPVPTYEAIKGILHSIYWKPTITWVVDGVRVMNPIVREAVDVRLLNYRVPSNDLAFYTYLKDVRYQVCAHFIWNMNRPEYENDRDVAKHMEVAMRALRAGGRFDVYLGTRECQADVYPCKFGEGAGAYDNAGRKDFGNMFHGFTYADEAYSDETRGYMSKRFWDAYMENGIITFPRPEDCTHVRVKEMGIKIFPDRKKKKEEKDGLAGAV